MFVCFFCADPSKNSLDMEITNYSLDFAAGKGRRPLTHLQRELQRGLQVGPQVLGGRVGDLHQRLEHGVVALVARVVHRLSRAENRSEFILQKLSIGSKEKKSCVSRTAFHKIKAILLKFQQVQL